MTVEPIPIRALIRVLWDNEVKVWGAASEDIPGLVVEAALLDEVVSEVRTLAHELLNLNDITKGKVLDLHFLADGLESVAAYR